MIFEGSRYANAPVLRVKDHDGVTRPAIYWDPFDSSTKFLYHTVIEGDRLDLLAFRYYRNAELWWFIANANPEVFYPEDLEPGQILRIPQA